MCLTEFLYCRIWSLFPFFDLSEDPWYALWCGDNGLDALGLSFSRFIELNPPRQPSSNISKETKRHPPCQTMTELCYDSSILSHVDRETNRMRPCGFIFVFNVTLRLTTMRIYILAQQKQRQQTATTETTEMRRAFGDN